MLGGILCTLRRVRKQPLVEACAFGENASVRSERRRAKADETPDNIVGNGDRLVRSAV